MATHYDVNSRILGAPLLFSDNADPGGKAYAEAYLNNQNIVSLVPGRPVYKQGKLAQEKYETIKAHLIEDDGKNSFGSGLFSSKSANVRGMPDDYYKDNMEPTRGQERDLRFYAFGTNFTEYRKIVNVLLNEVIPKTAGMSFGKDIASYIQIMDVYSEGVHFWAEASSSVSVSNSNEISDSMLSSLTSGVSAKMKELAFITGGAAGPAQVNPEELKNQENDSGLIQSLGSGILDMASGIGSIFGDAAGSVISGDNLLFPKIYKDSKTNTAVNLQFKFYSPYNDPQSIAEYVYIPFLALMGFCFPIQRNPTSFASPFLVRAQSPGWFNISMGMVNNFSFNLGGAEQLFNYNGLPRIIDCTMSIVDMYPTMALASDYAVLNGSIGLSTFLDCLAGLSLMRANIKEELSAAVAQRLGIFTGMKGAIASVVGDRITALTDTIFK